MWFSLVMLYHVRLCYSVVFCYVMLGHIICLYVMVGYVKLNCFDMLCNTI